MQTYTHTLFLSDTNIEEKTRRKISIVQIKLNKKLFVCTTEQQNWRKMKSFLSLDWAISIYALNII